MICEKPIGDGKNVLVLETESLEELNRLLEKVTYTSTVYHIHTGDLGTLTPSALMYGLGDVIEIFVLNVCSGLKKRFSHVSVSFCTQNLQMLLWLTLCVSTRIYSYRVSNLFCSSLLV